MSWGTSHSFNCFVQTQLCDLRERFGMAMWFLARRHGDDWLALRAVGEGYDLGQGDAFPWRDSLCHRRVLEQGPLICPDLRQEPVYQHAPITERLKIGAYIGLPLIDQNDELFGTLCALDPNPQPHLLQPGVHSALRRQCRLLEAALVWNLTGLDQQRVTDFFEEEERDPETGLLNTDGWSRVLERERQRCRDYGLSATLLHLQGDTIDHSRREQLADSLAALIRDHDTAAHLGDGQFSVLLTELSVNDTEEVRNRILDALNAKSLWLKCETEALALS